MTLADGAARPPPPLETQNQDGKTPAELTKDVEILAMLSDPSKADAFDQD